MVVNALDFATGLVREQLRLEREGGLDARACARMIRAALLRLRLAPLENVEEFARACAKRARETPRLKWGEAFDYFPRPRRIAVLKRAEHVARIFERAAKIV